MIEVVCICGARIKAQAGHEGLSLKCPKCRKLVRVTAGPPVAETPSLDLEQGPGLAPVPPPGDDLPATGALEGPRVDAVPRPEGVARQLDASPPDPAIERLLWLGQGIKGRLGWILLLLVLQLMLSLWRLGAGSPSVGR